MTAAEWGDASQIGTAALAAHLHHPIQVVIGATLGLWLGTFLAVALGRIVGPRIPAHWLRRGAGILFLLFAGFAAFRAKRTLSFALAVLAVWLGLQRLIFEGVGGASGGALLLSAVTAVAALILVVSAHRKIGLL